MSSAVGASIYTGFWINWSYGHVYGSIITLSQRSGSLLTSFLGIYVTAAGAACWRTLRFLMHQFRSKVRPREGVYRQQQVIFRNSGAPGGAIWEFVQSIWHEGRDIDKDASLNFPFIAIALCDLILFAVAGVFAASAIIKAAGKDVLINSDKCGFLKPTNGNLSNQAEYNAWDSNGIRAASAYSQICYNNSRNELGCGTYTIPRLPWNTQTNVSCPFQSNLCLEGPTSTIRLDTDKINSNGKLGLNAKESDRIQFRRVTECSVLNTPAYSDTTNQTTDGKIQTLARFYFGGAAGPNFTTEYNLNATSGLSGYTLTSFEAIAGTDSRGWIPIPALQRTDADVTIIFLAPNAVGYTSPVYDPLYVATTAFNSSLINGTVYNPDYIKGHLPVQINFSTVTRTETSAQVSQAPLALGQQTLLNLNAVQKLTLESLGYASLLQSTYTSVHNVGADALNASYILDNTNFISTGLPITQWMIEVSNWFSINMARLQQTMVNSATVQSHPGMTFVPAGKNLCNRQKIQNPGSHTSFSVLGLAITLVFGFLLIITGLFIDKVVGLVMQTFHWKDYKREQWEDDETLELLRRAEEWASQRQSSGESDSMPLQPIGEASSAHDSRSERDDLH